MHPNSQAYKDAWARIRKAIANEAELREIPLTGAALDDMACEAAHAAFGMDDDDDDDDAEAPRAAAPTYEAGQVFDDFR